MQVIKRNGEKQEFNFEKIKNAVNKAFNSVYKVDAPDNLIDYLKAISSTFKTDKTIEEIQDFVEDTLMEFKWFDVAKEYIVYRDNHNNIRNWVEEKERFINKYKNSGNTADATIDDNSNVSGKNVGILNAEIHKSDNIQISRKMIMDKLKELYPDFDSKQYLRDLEHHIIYKHDESSFAGAIAPYCCSISMYPFLTDGIKNLGGLSAAPKNLDSFCGMYINLIFATSAMFAGAVATSEFLLYFDYFARKE
jgi:ribonucleoside-triphosphate reductase